MKWRGHQASSADRPVCCVAGRWPAWLRPTGQSAIQQTSGLRYGKPRTCPWWLELLVAIFASAFAIAQQPAPDDAPVRFVAVAVYVDSKEQSLAAYQIEFSVTNTVAKIVGIEGGEHPAFSEPPFYDPKAMQYERVILAAFSTNAPAALPKSKTRIATIHLELRGHVAPEFQLKLQTAADADGKIIPAEVIAQQIELP